MDNVKTWAGLPVKEPIRMTEDRDKWRKYVQWCGQPWDQGQLKKNRAEQNRTERRSTKILVSLNLTPLTCLVLKGILRERREEMKK